MKEWLDDIRVEIQTLKTCISRLSEQVDRLEIKLEEAEKRPISVQMAGEQSSVMTSVSSPRVNERVKASAGLRHGLSLNDSFRFTRELFEGDTARMNGILDALERAETLDMAIRIFKNEVTLPEDNETVVDFMELLHKHFN